MRRLRRAVGRTIFWSYERGSWPYDAAVVAILAFVLLAPRGWFRDRAGSSSPQAGEIAVISTDEASARKTYRVSASLLPAPKRSAKRTPELEREIHSLLRRNVDELREQTFQILHIEAVQDAGSVVYYDVTVKPSTP